MTRRKTSGHRRVPYGLNLSSGDDNVGFHEHANSRKTERTKPCQTSLGTASLESVGQVRRGTIRRREVQTLGEEDGVDMGAQ